MTDPGSADSFAHGLSLAGTLKAGACTGGYLTLSLVTAEPISIRQSIYTPLLRPSLPDSCETG